MGPILYIPGHGETFKKRADARHRSLTCLPPRALTPVTLFGDRGCPSRRHSPAVRLLRIRHEQAPSEPCPVERADQRLGSRRDQELGERPAPGDVDARRVPGIELQHVVHVVQEWVALDQRHELQLVPPGEVRRPVGEGVAVLLVGELQRGAHALSRLDVRAPERRHGQPRALAPARSPGRSPPGGGGWGGGPGGGGSEGGGRGGGWWWGGGGLGGLGGLGGGGDGGLGLRPKDYPPTPPPAYPPAFSLPPHL